MVEAQMGRIDFSSITKMQHRVLGMWFRGLLKELGVINLTKHEVSSSCLAPSHCLSK
jgi:hypothetical protein